MAQIIILSLCVIIIAALLSMLFYWPAILLLGYIGAFSDKDPKENKCDGFNSSEWRHGYICEKCMSFVSHDERMTGICLSCGDDFDWHHGAVSTRLIIKNGSWARQLKWLGKSYINNKAID
jgi:hypothetical protein